VEHDDAKEDAEPKTPVSLKAPWEDRQSPELDLSLGHATDTHNRHSTTSEGSSGGLFKRMRSIFEQPRHHSTRDSHPAGPTRSRQSSNAWFPQHAQTVHSPTNRHFSQLHSPPLPTNRQADADRFLHHYPPTGSHGYNSQYQNQGQNQHQNQN